MSERSQLLSPPATANFRGHIAELDSIRAIGICIVLINHFWPENLSSVLFHFGQLGWIAMDAFFVLSGFLITGILLDTRSRSDYFSNYYIRRSLRIFPIYYATLLAAIILMKLGRGGAEYKEFLHNWGSPAWFFFYVGNFKVVYLNKWPPLKYFTVLWSLQIEEQFYLLFPFAVRYMRRENLTRLLWLLVVLSPLFRLAFYLWNPNNMIIQYELLPCHMEGLALGALIAIRFRTGPWEVSKPRLLALTTGLMLVTVIGSCLSKAPLPHMSHLSLFARLPGYTISSFAAAGLVIALVVFRGSTYTRLLRTAPIRYMAAISYGIYLLHMLVARFVRSWGGVGIHVTYGTFLHFFAVVSLTIVAASISWFAFERPLARLKDRIAPSRVPSGSGTTVREKSTAPAIAAGAAQAPELSAAKASGD